jgi:hypothetical protein
MTCNNNNTLILNSNIFSEEAKESLRVEVIQFTVYLDTLGEPAIRLLQAYTHEILEALSQNNNLCPSDISALLYQFIANIFRVAQKPLPEKKPFISFCETLAMDISKRSKN